MNTLRVFLVLSFLCLISAKSQDYGRHIELSLLFYECQRSGKLPKDNRIYWRHDSMTDAGSDVGVDLTGGYYDAGDNVKYNFPAAWSMTMLAWSGIEFKDGYEKAGQWKYLLDAVKWGTDYFIKCHSGKDTLYIGVGVGQTDHAYWVQPEYINYEYPSFKVTASKPGSEVAAETASALAAASILFKSEDSSYANTCLKHAEEIYEFADKHRGEYMVSEPSVQGFYSSYSGYLDELAWGAAWLLRATGDESYKEKYNTIADAEYSPQDPKKYTGATGSISWDDKRPGAYVLIAEVTKDEKRLAIAEEYCDGILKQPTTPGGLWYDTQLSMWASNRYASNAAAMVAMCAVILPDSKNNKNYISFVQKQMDYIIGNNPAKVDYVVGADESSPKAVHHRGASSVYDPIGTPSFNIFTLYGALAGGPGSSDTYKDSRDNYQMNEVALDYNAGFTFDLAALLHFGLGTKDGKMDFDRAWPCKAQKGDLKVTMDSEGFSISSGSGMLCASWCISFTTESEIDSAWECTELKKEPPNYTFCNHRTSGFLDGKGTAQKGQFSVKDKANFKAPTEFEVLCNGFRVYDGPGTPAYKPEYGHSYKVSGGTTKALFEESECWPAHIC